MPKTMASEWAEFAQAALPDSTALRQRAEMKRAFYAGAFCALSLLGESIAGPEATAIARLAQRIRILDAECQAFVRARILADLRDDELGP